MHAVLNMVQTNSSTSLLTGAVLLPSLTRGDAVELCIVVAELAPSGCAQSRSEKELQVNCAQAYTSPYREQASLVNDPQLRLIGVTCAAACAIQLRAQPMLSHRIVIVWNTIVAAAHCCSECCSAPNAPRTESRRRLAAQTI